MNKETFRTLIKFGLLYFAGMQVQRGKLDPTSFEFLSSLLLGGAVAADATVLKPTATPNG